MTEVLEYTDINDRIDQLELAMQEFEPVDCPVSHYFVPGYYVRTIVMGAGSLITSLIHNTRHAFNVSEGSVSVRVNDEEWEEIAAPHWGITEPGTRRVLMVKERCTWTTFHPILDSEWPMSDSDADINEAVCRIGDRILVAHANKYLNGSIKNNIITKLIEHETD